MIDIYYLKNRRSIKSNQESNNFDFLDTLKTLFGEESTDIVIDWFEDTYGYKVNTLI